MEIGADRSVILRLTRENTLSPACLRLAPAERCAVVPRTTRAGTAASAEDPDGPVTGRVLRPIGGVGWDEISSSISPTVAVGPVGRVSDSGAGCAFRASAAARCSCATREAAERL